MMQGNQLDWYVLKDEESVDTPALLIYRERVQKNIDQLLSMIDQKNRLRPHMKTNKSVEAARMLIEAGIKKFKCATIAEAETLAYAHADEILLAYQPNRPKQLRLLQLIKAYPQIKFSCLIDNFETAKQLASLGTEHQLVLQVYIDINLGMNRTGIEPGESAIDLIKRVDAITGIHIQGLHVYDGHIRDKDFDTRAQRCNEAFTKIEQMVSALSDYDFDIVAGGSPTFPIHATRSGVECSPGTFIYWDQGYSEVCAEQPFIPAALVMCRIISIPSENHVCLDLGHKSIAAENLLGRRVKFLNASVSRFIGQSEEHLVVEVEKNHNWKVGDVWYGVPIHICPTVALYDFGHEVVARELVSEWKTIARDRRLKY